METPVTFRFCTLDGAPEGWGAAIFTLLEAVPTTPDPPRRCCVADTVRLTLPLVVGVQFMLAVHVATGVNEPLLTGVQVPAMVPMSLPFLIAKSKVMAPPSSSQDASALSDTYVAFSTWLIPTVPLPAARVVLPLFADAGAASAIDAMSAPTPATATASVVLFVIDVPSDACPFAAANPGPLV